MKEIKNGTILYYARCLDRCGIFEVSELKVRTVKDDWFAGVDKNSKQVFLFSNRDIDKSIFFDRNTALDVVKTAEKNCKRKFTDEKYYEEY